MQKLQDSVFTLAKTTNLSPAVFSFLQPSDEFGDKTPLGGILKDTKYGWLALGPKFCVVDLRTGMKIAARTFGATLSNNATVTSVVELPTPLTENSRQLIISLQCEDISIIVVLNINGSQILRCIQTDEVVTQLAICDEAPDGIFTCFDGIVVAGTKRGEIFAFDLNRATLIQALKDISQGYEHLIQNELKPTNLSFLPLKAINRIDEQRELALENDHHLAVLLNENSFVDGQYIFRNPDDSVRMKAKRDHIRVTVLEYIPQTGSLAVGFNFGAFQIWNLMTLDLEFTSQVNVECLPVTHFGFQEPCDDPRAFCYLWVIFSCVDRFEEEEFPLAVMYSLTYQGKRMLSDTKCLYQDFSSATVRFQVDLSSGNRTPQLGGKCISCHTYSIKSNLGDEGEDSMLNLCQLVWESWAGNSNSPMQYGMLLFDLDQWYKDQMPTSYQVESNAFLSASSWSELSGGSGSVALHARLDPASVSPYSHATRLEEHFFPNSLQFNCICLNTSEVCVLSTIGIQRQIINSLEQVGPTVLLSPERVYASCVACGLQPMYAAQHSHLSQEDQRRYLLSVALEARLARFLKRCAHDWATGSHGGIGCTLPFLVDWCWKRAIELKENAKELTAPLFASRALADRNIARCLEHCVQQLTQLTGLMDSVLTKCCNLVVPMALSEMEEKHKGIGTVSLYFQVVQWFLRVGLLPERVDGSEAVPYPCMQLCQTYNKRRLKLNRLNDNGCSLDNSAHTSCALLYIDQLLENEFGGPIIHQMWIKGGSECGGLYPPPSLYALLRLYLRPDIAEEHKHSLVLYLLVDYSMIYEDVRYEPVIRRLMQFPTMFGLSNTAIKATQAFWHLDHRDFDFALDQLQCLTGNTLSEWQHNVVLSSLLAQKKTQAALQYLHVRKPAPIQNVKDEDYSKLNDYDKLNDWQSCCNLYLARGLVFEALDVIRMCVQNAGAVDEKTQVLNLFFKGCRNTGNLSKVLSITLQPFEEEVFVKYLENCNEPQTSDILVMYYLQQARYIEAERYNLKLRHAKPKFKDLSNSLDSVFDANDREIARDNLVETMCAALPPIAESVAHCALQDTDIDWNVRAPKPMSVFVKAKSAQNTFTYKSTFIQDTIQNASETWICKPQMRKGIKRLLNIEETPFICTPKLSRTKSVFPDAQYETPSKRARHSFSGTPKTPKSKAFEALSSQMEELLDMPEIQSPLRLYERADTPHSILKSRNSRLETESPCGSRYLDETDDELEMETASNHTHYSDSTNKQLRFTIPTPTDPGTAPTPSPITTNQMPSFSVKERERSESTERDRDLDISTTESYVTTASHAMNESNPLESPPKKLATEANVSVKRSYRDSVRARGSLSISANSSLSDDPNTSIESIADIPFTLFNPRYSGSKSHPEIQVSKEDNSILTNRASDEGERDDNSYKLEIPAVPTPRGRRGIRASGENTPLRSGSITPERRESPVVTPLRGRISRSRSKTPEVSPRSSPLAVILEQPRQEAESGAHAETSALTLPRSLRSRSRTPERLDRVRDSPKLEAISESPTKSGSDSPIGSPSRRRMRSRSRTPEVEPILDEPVLNPSPRNLRSRSKTPEICKKDHPVKTKKSLSRLVLEANTFAKTKQTLESLETETETTEKRSKAAIECTPMKPQKQPLLMDMTLSPIVNKSILQSSNDSLTDSVEKEPKNITRKDINTVPLLVMEQESYIEKSVLHSYESSLGETSKSIEEVATRTETRNIAIPAFTTIHEDFGHSVLHSFESSVASTSQSMDETPRKDTKVKPFVMATPKADFASVLHSEHSSIANDTTQTINASSLMTEDNEDVEMDEDEQRENIEDIAIEDSNDKTTATSSKDPTESESDSSSSSSSDDDSSSESSSDDGDTVAVSSETSESSSDSTTTSDPIPLPVSPEKIEEQVKKLMQTIKFDAETSGESSLDYDAKSTTSESNHSKQSSDKASDVEPKDFSKAGTSKKARASLPQASLITEDGSNVEELEISIANPLDQAQASLMTDDNSTIIQDKTATEESVTKSSGKQKDVEVVAGTSKQQDNIEASSKEDKKQEVETEKPGTSKQEVEIQKVEEVETSKPVETVKEVETAPQLQDSLMTEDNSDRSDQEISLNYSDEKESDTADDQVQCELSVETTEEATNLQNSPKRIDVVVTHEIEMNEADIIKTASETIEEKSKIEQNVAKKSEVMEVEKKEEAKESSEVNKKEEDIKSQVRTRKRSISSNVESEMEAEPRTPTTSKQAQSRAKSVDLDIPRESTESKKEAMDIEIPKTKIRGQSREKSVDIDIPREPTESEMKPVENEKPKSVDIEMPRESTESEKEPVEIENPKTRKRGQSREKSDNIAMPRESTESEKEASGIEKSKTKKRGISREKSVDIEMPRESTESEMEATGIEKPKSKKRGLSREKSVDIEMPRESTESEMEATSIEKPKTKKRGQSREKSVDIEMPRESTESEREPVENEKPKTKKRGQSREKSVDIEMPRESTESEMEATGIEKPKTKKRGQSREKSVDIEMPRESTESEMEATGIEKPKTKKRGQSREKSVDIEMPRESTESEKEPVENEKPKTKKRGQSREKSVDIEIPKESESEKGKEIVETKSRKLAQSKAKSFEPENKEIDQLKTPTRKRVIKTTKDETAIEEVKTPVTSKRAPSVASNESEENTPEKEKGTPSRNKTPSDVSKMVTRRMSREMKDEDESLTPKKISKIADDNESVASGSSIASSVQSGESRRRGRKSTVATKPDLSVIPEVLAEESREQSTLDVIDEYSGARRLTRHQKTMLETSRGRRPSNTSRVSKSSLSEVDEEERTPAFDLQPIDRISLLNKESYNGPPDTDEVGFGSMSPESIASDASKMNKSRMGRAASETKVVKAAKIHRRIASVDVSESPVSSPVLSSTDSPARSRRASFNRAIEALQTPKGRRQSTDSNRVSNSPANSPAQSEAEVSMTPTRRGRRASTQSNTSQSGRSRAKKMPVLEEDGK